VIVYSGLGLWSSIYDLYDVYESGRSILPNHGYPAISSLRPHKPAFPSCSEHRCSSFQLVFPRSTTRVPLSMPSDQPPWPSFAGILRPGEGSQLASEASRSIKYHVCVRGKNWSRKERKGKYLQLSKTTFHHSSQTNSNVHPLMYYKEQHTRYALPPRTAPRNQLRSRRR